MGYIYTEIADYDKVYETLPNTILLNDLPYITAEDREAFSNILLTKIDSGILSPIASCVCGKYRYSFHKTMICEKCESEIKPSTETIIDTKVWITVPKEVKGFILPFLWDKLTSLLSAKGYSILQWAVDSSHTPPEKQLSNPTKERIIYLNNRKWIRSLNYFIDNWEVFFQMIEDTTKDPKKSLVIKDLNILRKYSHLFFPKYLPIPTKALMILEETNVGTYADTSTMSNAIAAATTVGVLSIPREPPQRPHSQRYLENQIVSVNVRLIEYCLATLRGNICTKNGYIRGHVFRARSDFTLRAVVTSIHTPHLYKEIHLPWAQSVVLFEPYLASYLEANATMTKVEYTNLITSSVNQYNPIIDEALKILIATGRPIPRIVKDDFEYFKYRGYTPEQMKIVTLPNVGIMVNLQRNPTLGLGSVQGLYITKIKTDLSDKTLSMSDLIANGFNADHDGDRP